MKINLYYLNHGKLSLGSDLFQQVKVLWMKCFEEIHRGLQQNKLVTKAEKSERNIEIIYKQLKQHYF